MTEDRQCGRAWWEFPLAVFIDNREEGFDDKKNGNSEKDGLEGKNIIHGKRCGHFL